MPEPERSMPQETEDSTTFGVTIQQINTGTSLVLQLLRLCLPLQGPGSIPRETEGQGRRIGPKSQEAPLGTCPAGDGPYRMEDSKLFAQFCIFGDNVNILPMPPPYWKSTATRPSLCRQEFDFKRFRLVNLLWGRILHFSLPLLAPQTYKSRNRELRHDTLMF